MEIGRHLYDSKNDRYILVKSRGCDWKVWQCEVCEYDEAEEDGMRHVDDQLFTESELNKMEVLQYGR